MALDQPPGGDGGQVGKLRATAWQAPASAAQDGSRCAAAGTGDQVTVTASRHPVLQTALACSSRSEHLLASCTSVRTGVPAPGVPSAAVIVSHIQCIQAAAS
jgi:hypothetical protein